MTVLPKFRGPRVSLLIAACVAVTACATCGLDSKMGLVKSGMKTDQVVALLGNPTRIDETETTDQTVTGEVYHYSTPSGDGRIVFVNGSVFSATILSGAKS